MSTGVPPLVVGVDGTDAGWQALDWALVRAAALRCPLRVVHACELTLLFLPRLDYDDDERQRRCERVVLEARVRLAAAHRSSATVEVAVNEGRPATVLRHRAAHARELVVGRRPMHRLERGFLGSTSRAVTAHMSIPVVVVPHVERPARTGEVVVGVDGSSDSQAAVEYAFSFAASCGADLLAVSAWEPLLPAYGTSVGAQLDRAREEASAAAAQSLAGWPEKFPEVAVRTELAQGHAVAVLARRAETAQLVAVGGRGRSLLGGLLLGSTAEGLVRRAGCPVAVVHQPQ